MVGNMSMWLVAERYFNGISVLHFEQNDVIQLINKNHHNYRNNNNNNNKNN